MPEGNGKFIRTIFWALLIGSFGWTTFVGYGLLQALASTATTAQTLAKGVEEKAIALAKCNSDIAEQMKREYVYRDEIILKEVNNNYLDVKQSLAELKTDIHYLRGRIK
jgi:hypothetical protein